jgi:hypothetical protein
LRRQGEVIRVPVCVGLGNKRRVVGHRQQRNRWFSVKVESEKQFARFASAFGLVGPSSRATIHVEEPNRRLEDDHELWALLTTPRPKKDPLNPPDVQ